MRIAIVGAGLVGVTTAYQLASEGHEVSVFERRGSVASEGSFAIAGLAAPGLSGLSCQAPVQGVGRAMIGLPLPGSRASWAWQRWRGGRAKAGESQTLALNQMLAAGLQQLQLWRQQLGIDDEHSKGLLCLLRSARDEQQIRRQETLLNDLGQTPRWLDAAQCLQQEPGLSPELALHGGLYLPHASAGNARQFAHALKSACQRLGVRWRFHATVTAITAGAPGSSPSLTHAHTPPELRELRRSEALSEQGPSTVPMPLEPQQERFDAIVVCAAQGSADLLKPLGLKLPLVAIHGFSITAPLRQLEAHPNLGPRAALLDLASGISICRLGQRVRVAGLPTLGVPSRRQQTLAQQSLHRVLHECFPGAAQTTAALAWSGAGTALPDGLPLLGPSGLAGIWLNLGQTDEGWALASASAKSLAELLAGRSSSIDAQAFNIERLR
ncbi:FAD-dependent oxidoreductase [Paucibacter sp. APW11]|uniref:FAD-dependent oxidoreductase n=1 Tax=Roseateles aquae TaxID=3077235 RepID=A0ABU3P7I1_9BURK|nr:FAD-dependent oxidoreductase [Paucibacter sp. APW11]MDT8998504.1 FAD-dependent oxidoreductase [Paucibacter sp. APW11]